METVSILIPCHDDEQFVGDALESALGQTWPYCEVIVVDDGSTDNSLAVAEEYEPQGVRVIQQSNRGPSAARNRALEAATGDYIQYLDADDLLHPEKVEAQVSTLRESEPRTVAVCSTVQFWDGESPEDGRRTAGADQVPWLNSEDPVQWLVNLWIPDSGWGMVQTSAWLVPRSVVEDAGPWNERITVDDDGEYFTRVVLESSGIRYVPDGCVYYRQYYGSRVSSWRSRSDLEGWLCAIDSKRDHLLPRTTGESRRNATYGLAQQYLTLACEAYPHHVKLAAEAEERAKALGQETMKPPQLTGSWWLDAVCGLSNWWVARYLQYSYRWLRSFLSFGPRRRHGPS